MEPIEYEATPNEPEASAPPPLVTKEKIICPNCDGKIPKKGKFCPHCGQKTFVGVPTMADILNRFLFNITHINKKLLYSVWHLLVPGKMTREFCLGRQKRYPHPVQLFFIIMFFFVLLLNHGLDNFFEGFGDGLETDDIEKPFNSKSTVTASHRDFNFYAGQYISYYRLKNSWDSIPQAWRTPESLKAVDSLSKYIFPELGSSRLSLLESDSLTLPFNFDNESSKIQFSKLDVARLSPDEITTKYKITEFWHKLTVRQGLKTVQSPKSLANFYVGTISWTLLMLIGFMAGFLWLVYFRQKRKYAEHFIFLMHYNAMAFALIIVLLLVSNYWDIPWWIATMLFIWIDVALLIAMRRYYGQSKTKTILKWILYNIVFGVMFLFFAILAGVVGLFVF